MRWPAYVLTCGILAGAGGCAHPPDPSDAPTSAARSEFTIAHAPGTRWVATYVDRQPVLPETEPSLDFTSTAAVGFGGCNGFGGAYDPRHPLAIKDDIITVAGCRRPEMSEQEDRFFRAVVAMRRGSVDDAGHLNLFDSAGVERARLKRRPTPPVSSRPIAGTRWALESFKGVSVPASEKVQLEFVDGTRFRAVHGCRLQVGTYAVEGETISFTSGESAEDRCNPDGGSWGEPTMTYPEDVQQFWSDGGRLHLIGRNHRRAILRLCPTCDLAPLSRRSP